MKFKKLTQMPRELLLNWVLPGTCNLNGMKNGLVQKLDPSSVSTTVKRLPSNIKISGLKLTFKSHPKSNKSLFKREVISILSNVTKASRRISSTNLELITSLKEMNTGLPIKTMSSSKLAKTLTIPPTSKEESTSMNNSLLTKSEFTSQALR